MRRSVRRAAAARAPLVAVALLAGAGFVAAPVLAPAAAADVAARADSTGASPARDTTSIWVAPPPPTRMIGAQAPSIVPRGQAPAEPDSASSAAAASEPRGRASAIDTTEATYRLEAIRKRGDVSLPEVFRGRAAVLAGLFPGFGSKDASLVLPDAGSRVRPWPAAGVVSDRATDATVVASVPLGLGAPDLATAWSGSDADGVDAFDLLWLDQGGSPAPFRSAGDLLASPRGESAETIAMPGEIRGGNHPRSALYYRKGEQGALDTGARFSSPLLARGVAASFVRHEADGLPPFLTSLSGRYALAAGLPRLGPIDAWVEANLFQKRTEVDIRDGYDEYFALNGIEANRERAEWASRGVTVHGRARSPRLDAGGALRIGHATATQVAYDGSRERWRFPEASFQGDATWRGDGPWTWIGAFDLASRRITYRADSIPAFSRRIESARLVAAGRRAVGGGWNAEGSLAGDLRESDAALLDARASLWRDDERGRIRVDLESAHERPSYVDLWTPPSGRQFFDPTAAPLPGRIYRAGDPTLGARALRGALGSADLSLSRHVRVLASGALRRVSDDFGWNVTRSGSPDSIVVLRVAGRRGDGWTAFGSLGYDVTAGALRARGLGWVRGSGDRSPQAGSPPRRGFDGLADLYVVFFGGDLPLHLDVAAHALGPRAGLIRAPASVTWDAGIRADFGAAGAFFEFDNVFDREVPSGVYRIETDAGAPLPRRTFHFGIVWYLLD